MKDFNIKKTVGKTINGNNTLLELFFNDYLQCNLLIDNEDVSLGVRDYIELGSGVITLRSAVPETQFSEYNTAKILCDYANNLGLTEVPLAPEQFGYKSYIAMRRDEEFDKLSKDELIERIIELENITDCY